MSEKGVSIFCSYCHVDEELRNSLDSHMATLKRKGVIEVWNDRKIVPGSNIHDEIDQHLNTSDLIVLLVSSDFIASDYCYEKELRVAIDRHDTNQAIIVPIIVRPCDWSDSAFSNILALPEDGKAVTAWENEDQAWLNVVKGIKKSIQNIRELKNRDRQHAGLKTIKQCLIREVDNIDRNIREYDNVSRCAGLPTGLRQLDEVIDGFHESEFIVLGGRPGSGVTDLMVNFALQVAVNRGPVAYYSLNLPDDRLTKKLIATAGRIHVRSLVNSINMDDQDWPRLTSAIAVLNDAPLYIDDAVSAEFESLIARIVEDKKTRNLDLVIIDSLQHLVLKASNNGSASEYSYISKRLSKLSRELKVPVIVGTTLSADLEERPNRRPIINDLGVWRNLEEDADTIIFLYRDDLYNYESPYKGLIDLYILKNILSESQRGIQAVYLEEFALIEDYVP